MNSARPRYLLDLNTPIGLSDPDHGSHRAVIARFKSESIPDWGVCPLTEAGPVRVTTHPAYRPTTRTVAQALADLTDFASRPGYRHRPIPEPRSLLIAPFAIRLYGHQQVTEAYLLALAVRHRGILVTFDRAIMYLAAEELRQHLLVLDWVAPSSALTIYRINQSYKLTAVTNPE